MWLEVQIGRRDIVPYIGYARALYMTGGAARVKVKLARVVLTCSVHNVAGRGRMKLNGPSATKICVNTMDR